ncbi:MULTISPECIES: sensor histidine kinase [Streptomyces]|uniref:sensor histidine kinase n=1 Tax=Streptomyces TaxID=1883 RepID=UPI0002F79B22|nr:MULTISPECIES: histidine kinase [Streptomyces]WDI17747.1 histidine kinase [Streptomyces enissocaesilis]MBU8549015.1 two-component sensor histidine kinase [Streptomyces sp. Osf17]MBU8555793.1 two-component sensor histidine kinase [Streptomyces sp. Babs14]MCC8454384.1 two-component sensor histidine kinase [Streptomyces rochei]MDI3095511.1 histidine kinase [Streptomyces sp. AN-3]
MSALARFLFGRRARLRWIHLILGGALAMPYVLVGSVVVGPFTGVDDVFGSLTLQLASFAVGLPLAAITSLFPLTRPLEAGVVRSLCGVEADRLAYGPARSKGEKGRTAAWFTLHLGVGGIVAGMSLAVPPFAAFLIVLPFVPALRDGRPGLPGPLDGAWGLALAPLAGAVTLVALAGCAAGCGALLARWAPALLGPSAEDRVAAAEARAADLAVRNRLARELHDSVGHALSAVTLQASAARRVLDSDPRFVREALAAIEETTRRTVGELDAVLGVLRDGDAPGTAPAPTLADDLDGLLDRTRAGGLRVSATVAADPRTLPPAVSREAYRIVQEGLSNALRHAGGRVTVAVGVDVLDGHLRITLENPLAGTGPTGTVAPRPGGGHGLRGIADRARVLGGSARAGPVGRIWRLEVRLPLGRTP